MSDTNELEKQHDVSYEELAKQVAQLKAEQDQLKSAIATGETDNPVLAKFIAQALDPNAVDEAAKARRRTQYQKRLDAKKRPYRYCGRAASVRIAPGETLNAAQLAGRDQALMREARRGERLLFDPADDLDRKGEQRAFNYGDRIDLSDIDRDALQRSGYLFVDLAAPGEVAADDHLTGAFKALEENDYHEATRILREENAMPRDASGNVVKTKAEVMERLGEWIDDQKG